jgi:hypothetical protein
MPISEAGSDTIPASSLMGSSPLTQNAPLSPNPSKEQWRASLAEMRQSVINMTDMGGRRQRKPVSAALAVSPVHAAWYCYGRLALHTPAAKHEASRPIDCEPAVDRAQDEEGARRRTCIPRRWAPLPSKTVC